MSTPRQGDDGRDGHAGARDEHAEPGANDVAIVGIALRFPGAHGAAEFWSNLRAGVESVRTFGDAELAERGVPARWLRDPAYVKAGLELEGVDRFDAEFFGFSPKDAAILDPQHRLFLECAFEALEDAAHPAETFKGPIGVFGGCGMDNYFAFNLLSNPALVEEVGLFLLRHTGNDKDFLTTRASYCLDLKGPSINVQTACSTSLVAVHVACQSLIGGECDMALAGGVSVELPHGVGYLHQAGEILSRDGHCRAFDQRASGTVFGSGVGIVALRRLEDALRDGDRIYAVVKGSAVNNDGASKVGYLAPGVDGQAAAIAEAIAMADVEADTIDFVEAHGSGTAMGDPIEVAALTRAFGPGSSRKSPCGLGSVKANIGHLNTAAGVASLVKAALALHRGEIPPAPNFEAPNPAIAFDATPFRVVRELTPWPRGERPRRAGVNSLGVGGTNAHVVLEEAPVPGTTSKPAREAQLLCLSARTPNALDAAARRLAIHLRENPEGELADVAFTLLAGRRAFAHRRVLCCSDPQAAVELLESADPQCVFTHTAGSERASVVFMLPGGGAQHVGMARDLYESEPAFREQVDRGIDEFQRRTGSDLRASWIAPVDLNAAARELQRPSLQLPAIFVLEYALAHLWASVGVRPEALIGHSLGENTAACLAGVLSFEDALGLIALRGQLFEELPRGGMSSVPLSEEALASWLGTDLDVAAVNAPDSTVVSGPIAALEDLERRLAESGIETGRIPITTAAHSRMVEPILARFLEHLRGIRLHPPRIPFLSNCTGTWITAEQAVRPEYWVDHLRSTVRFADGVRALLSDEKRVLLEVGPGKALCSLVRQQPEKGAVRGVFATLPHAEEKTSDSAHFLTAFGRAWACGVPVDTSFPWSGERRARVSLPTYPFERARHWIDPGRPNQAADEVESKPRRLEILAEGFYEPVWKPVASDPEPGAGRPRTWLVFLDSARVGELLAQRLRARGDKVITVREGDDNCRLGEGEYALAPERGRDGYADLVRDLVASGAMPERIVHLWMLTPDESFRPGSNFFHRNQERGFYSLFFLAQALGDEGIRGPLHVTVVGNGMQALEGETLVHPDKATILGPCKVIPREFQGVTCSSVDLPFPVSRTRLRRRALRSARLEALVDVVEREVLGAPRCAIVAHRKGQRFEQSFERRALEPAATKGKAPIRERGVYLVTGGLGGLGLVLAVHLARHARARLTLTSRSKFPERGEWDDWLARHGQDDATSRRIRALREVEAAGGEVFVACADVTDVEAMRGVIDETRRRFGALHGVVHAAGLLHDAPILSKTQEEVEEVFAPKVHGTLVLDACLRDVDLDFLLLFSSASAIVAPPGQVDYVAACSFLDAYAHGASGSGRGAKGSARRTISVNWGIWSEAGMASNALDSSEAPAPPHESGATTRHPLFDSRGSDPDEPLALRARYSPQTHWILDEHRTRGGNAIVPGTAYLEMARAALVEAGEEPIFEVRDLLFLRPLHVADGASKEVQVELVPDVEGYAFHVRSRASAADADEPWETHVQARLLLRTPPVPKRVPLAEIEARCLPGRAASGSLALPSVQEDLVRFGPRWQTLRDIRFGSREALATLELDAAFAGDLEHYGLHPALLDIATSCGLELFEATPAGERAEGLWVPISYKSVRIHGPLTARVRSWVKSRASNGDGAKVRLFDVVVVGDDGRVRVEIEQFAMRRLPLELDLGRLPAGRAPSAASKSEHALPVEGSLARSFSPSRSALRGNLERGITAAEGMEALHRILSKPRLAQVVATSLDLDGLVRQAEALAAPEATRVEHARSEGDAGSAEPADGIERTLIGFWKELLGVRSVGLRDSFFDLGGHSLIAVRLFARIKKTYQVEFPISLLFEAPTIERCADAIRRATGAEKGVQAIHGKREPRYVHLVPMHPGQGGAKTPFFLVAGMFGNVLNLRHLAHLLGNERRLFGLQARGLYGAHRLHETFEEMAADYLVEVRRAQPSGPYLLGGFSGGGITAYEMAQELRAAGEEVLLLAMLDTSLPRAPLLTPSDRARIHWERMRRRGPAYVVDWALGKLRFQAAAIQKRRQAKNGAPVAAEFRSEEVGAGFLRALARYRVRPYPGTVTLFRPKLEIAHVLGPGRVTNSRREFVFHDNGWGPYVDRVDVHEVPGDHDSMVLEPNVRVLAARLRKCIQEAESGLQRSAPAGRRLVASN